MNYDFAYVNEEFLNYIKDFKMSRDIKEALKTAIKLNLEDRIKNNSGVKEKLTQRLTQIDAERKEVVRKNIKGALTDKITQDTIGDYDAEETEIRLKLNEMSDDTEDVEFGVNKLSNLVETFQEIEDPEIRFRFQKWFFPQA